MADRSGGPSQLLGIGVVTTSSLLLSSPPPSLSRPRHSPHHPQPPARGFVTADGTSDAILIYTHMQHTSLSRNYFTFPFVLKTCAHLAISRPLGDLKSREWMYQCVEETGKDKNIFVANSVIDMYAKCVSMKKVRGVFDVMAERDVVTWSTMIGGYLSNGLPQTALELFS